MPQVLDLINDAYALIGEYDTSGPLSAADTQLGFRALNRMLQSWSNDRSMVYAIRQRSFPLIAGQATYNTTVLLGTRPIKIEAQNILDSSGVTHYLEQVDVGKWSTISYPVQPGIPYWLYVEPASVVPGLACNFYPTPYGGLTAQLWCWELLTQFANTSDVVSLPLGYEDALIYNLALRIAPMFDRRAAQEVINTAAQAKYAIETTNLPNQELSVAFVPTASRAGWFNWRSGEVE